MNLDKTRKNIMAAALLMENGFHDQADIFINVAFGPQTVTPDNPSHDNLVRRIFDTMGTTPHTHRIAWIKEWRANTGDGLKESKEAVDRIIVRWNQIFNICS